mmetsp:Transcript_28274/g.68800  ORF Transcript_28274/g.68800 Transcript_28274/m.68800 type:complete len:247 (-) Transcript_28274:264-1004(-)|eukprot:CAMPEP_0113516260 /NCGR_PEP_ID=MMETSP0014_2-20120614/41449_1 /TAXON_ID=2857 /ORGANISM="Nitzschia sp." /LENGTH=246 /DNA_ID=CAMNT_0000413015 /DNA_START=468 /DNA_END=1208 /DNA_ORIENTATION=+ /assembly_acc=CAM_ASM_000159
MNNDGDDDDLDEDMNDAVMIEDDDDDDVAEDEQRRMILEVANEIRNVNIVDGRQRQQQPVGAGGGARDAAGDENGNAAGNDPPAVRWENRIPDMLLDHPAVVAFQASNASFLVTDPNLPGNPIIYASEAFLQLTGYPVDRVLGRNCRFLQGPETNPVSVGRMREAIDNVEDIVVRVLNYRWDGTTFWNDVLISAVRNTRIDQGENGGVLYFLGLQQAVVDGNDDDNNNNFDIENRNQNRGDIVPNE